jgi:hypothetical protein
MEQRDVVERGSCWVQRGAARLPIGGWRRSRARRVCSLTVPPTTSLTPQLAASGGEADRARSARDRPRPQPACRGRRPCRLERLGAAAPAATLSAPAPRAPRPRCGLVELAELGLDRRHAGTKRDVRFIGTPLMEWANRHRWSNAHELPSLRPPRQPTTARWEATPRSAASLSAGCAATMLPHQRFRERARDGPRRPAPNERRRIVRAAGPRPPAGSVADLRGRLCRALSHPPHRSVSTFPMRGMLSAACGCAAHAMRVDG